MIAAELRLTKWTVECFFTLTNTLTVESPCGIEPQSLANENLTIRLWRFTPTEAVFSLNWVSLNKILRTINNKQKTTHFKPQPRPRPQPQIQPQTTQHEMMIIGWDTLPPRYSEPRGLRFIVTTFAITQQTTETPFNKLTNCTPTKYLYLNQIP